MDDEYVKNNVATFPWMLLPRKVYEFFVRWFGGHYISDDR